jgi:hypothetical protein
VCAAIPVVIPSVLIGLSMGTQMQANHSVKIPGPKKALQLAVTHEHFLVAKPELPLHENSWKSRERN